MSNPSLPYPNFDDNFDLALRRLAHDVDSSRVDAKYADGELTLKLPKAAVADSRRIPVR